MYVAKELFCNTFGKQLQAITSANEIIFGWEEEFVNVLDNNRFKYCFVWTRNNE